MPHLLEILAHVALYLTAGFVPAHLLLPDDEDRPLRLPLAAILGWAILEVLTLNLFVAGLPTRHTAWPLAGAAVLATAAYWWLARPAVDRSESRWPLVLGAIAMVLASWPGLVAGGERYMALANPDANNYQFLADYFEDQTFRTPVELDGYHPGRLHIHNARKTGDRIGPDLMLSAASVMGGRSTKGEYFFVLAALAALLPAATYLFCRMGVGMAPAGSRAAATLTAVSGLSALVVYQQLLGNLAGAVLAPVAMAAGLRVMERATVRSAVLAGILGAALIGAYPEMLFLLGPAWAVAAVVMGRSGRLAPIGAAARAAGLAILVAVAANAYYGYRAAEILLQQSSARAGGDSYAFAMTGWLWPVVLGMAPGFHADHAFLGLPGAVWVAAGLLAAAGLAVAARLAWREAAVRPAVAGLAVTAALAGWLLLGRGYSYGGFKALLYGSFFAAAVAGAMWESPWLPTGNRRALFRASLGVVLLANLLTAGWTGAYTLGMVPSSPAPEAFLTGDASFDELEREAARLAGERAVLVDVDPAAEQLWTVYALRARRVGVRNATEYLAFWSRLFRVPVEHGFSEDLVVREAAKSDIVGPGGERLWAGGRLELRTLRDYGMTGAGWYGLEGKGADAFRWLEREGEILVAHPSAGEMGLRFEAMPGPGGGGKERTVEVYRGEERIHMARVMGRTVVVTPRVAVTGPVVRFRIRVVETAEPLATDPRRLNLEVRRVRVESTAAAEPAVVSGGGAAGSPAPVKEVEQDQPFGDGWAGARVAFGLTRPAGKTRLEVTGEVPGFAKYRFPYTLAVTVNGRPAGTVTVTAPGRFRGEVALPGAAAGSAERVVVTPGATFQPSQVMGGADTRRLSVRGVAVAYR